MTFDLEFEAPLRILDADLTKLRRSGGEEDQADALEQEINAKTADLYSHLSAWQTVQVARHKSRPYTLDYVKWLLTDFVELHGDRRFGDDRAILGGPALLDGSPVMLVGHQKGRDTKSNLDHNFGMPNPEGYRKAVRLFRQAEKFGMPIITLVDTPGANPSLPAEERGQAQAIAECIAVMLSVRTPTVSVITGEGGSGGALAIAVPDRLLMLEYSVFTVASPEAAASILWRDSGQAAEAAAAMKITAHDLIQLGIVDRIISEPAGGAHRDHHKAATLLRSAIQAELAELGAVPIDELIQNRHEKYRRIGAVG